jgi:hypothetical protein
MARPMCISSPSPKCMVLALNGVEPRLAELECNLTDQALTHLWLVKPE